MKDSWKFGIVGAAATFAVFSLLGFEQKTEKYGVVDVAKVFNESDFTKKQNEQLRAVGQVRTAILDFMDNYRVLTPEAATRFRDLSLKDPKSAAEQAELDKIKADAQAADKAFKDLQTKTSPTPAEVNQLTDYNSRLRTSADLSRRWAQEFDNEVRDLNEKLRGQTMSHVTTALKDVGAKNGFTVLFSQDVAPYGANDVTQDAIDAMNKQKD